MINEIRSYFKTRINDVDSDLIEHNNPFDDDIPESIIEGTYIMKIGQITSKFIDDSVEDSVPVTIMIHRNGANDILENFYSFYQNAHLLRLCAIDPKLSRNGIYIKNVICETITPLLKEGSDNVIIYTLEFKVSLHFQLDYS